MPQAGLHRRATNPATNPATNSPFVQNIWLPSIALLFLALLACPPIEATTECDFWYLAGATKARSDYWVTVGPLGMPPSNVALAYYFWQQCGPAFPDVISSISIVSLDTREQSRLCKVAIRTVGGQSYSFGEHCLGGLPQTLLLFPGERILEAALAVNPRTLNPTTVGGAELKGPSLFVDSLLCLKTSYGDTLMSGLAACDTTTVFASENTTRINSGLLAGIGGTTSLDDAGSEYVTSLFLIFHPKPDFITYDLKTLEVLDPPTKTHSGMQICRGQQGYCDIQSTTVNAGTCSLSMHISDTFSVTASDTVSKTFGIAQSQALTTGTTDGQETGRTLGVTQTTSDSTGNVLGIAITNSTSQGITTSEGITVSKQRATTDTVTDTNSNAQSWSDATMSGQQKSFSRSDTQESTNSVEQASGTTLTRGTKLIDSTTDSISNTNTNTQTNTKEDSFSSTVHRDVTDSSSSTKTDMTSNSVADTTGTNTHKGGSKTTSEFKGDNEWTLGLNGELDGTLFRRRHLLDDGGGSGSLEGSTEPVPSELHSLRRILLAMDGSSDPDQLGMSTGAEAVGTDAQDGDGGAGGEGLATFSFFKRIGVVPNRLALLDAVKPPQLTFDTPAAVEGAAVKGAGSQGRRLLFWPFEEIGKVVSDVGGKIVDGVKGVGEGAVNIGKGIITGDPGQVVNGFAGILKSGTSLLPGNLNPMGMVPGGLGGIGNLMGMAGGGSAAFTPENICKTVEKGLDLGRRHLLLGVSGGISGSCTGGGDSVTTDNSETWDDVTINTQTNTKESSTSFAATQGRAVTQGTANTQGSMQSVSASAAQAFTSAKSRTSGSEVSEDLATSNTLTTGSSNTVGTTTGSGETFLQQQTSERGGTTEFSRAHGFGVTDTTGEETNSEKSINLVGTREISETSQITKQTTDALAKNSQTHDTAFRQVMSQDTFEYSSNQNEGTSSTNGTGYSFSMETIFEISQQFSAAAQEVRLSMQIETYKDTRFKAMADFRLKGFASALRIPVEGVMNGRFSTATSTVDTSAVIDCGGPKPYDIDIGEPFYTTETAEYYIGNYPTSYRHGLGACRAHNMNLAAITTLAKQEAVMAALRDTRSMLTTPVWIGAVYDNTFILGSQVPLGWRWLDGTPWTSFFAWSKDAKLRGPSKCLSAEWRGTKTDRWLTVALCSELQYFICERKIEEVCPAGTAGFPPSCIPCTGTKYADGLVPRATCLECFPPFVPLDRDDDQRNDGCGCSVGRAGSSDSGCKACTGNTYADVAGLPRCKVCPAPGYPVNLDGSSGNEACTSSSDIPDQPNPPSPSPPLPTSPQPPPSCGALWYRLKDDIAKLPTSLNTAVSTACGRVLLRNKQAAQESNTTASMCASDADVTRCIRDLQPLVDDMVLSRCCPQLSKLVEYFRPDAGVCVIGTSIPLRYAFGFFHEAARCEGYPRLVNGWQDGSSGRVEIYHGGQVGTVCDDKWDDDDANVVCKQLGFDGGYADWGATFGPGYEWQPIWMHRVACNGSETKLTDCPFYKGSTWGLHTCSHWEDAGATCYNCKSCVQCAGMLRLQASTSGNAPEGSSPQVSEFVGQSWEEGRLEIWHNLNWGTVCSDWFHRINADVSCRLMGAHAGFLLPKQDRQKYLLNETEFYLKNRIPPSIWLDNVDCAGNEDANSSDGSRGGLDTCKRNAWGHHDCTHAQDVVLRCVKYEEGFVRLVDGTPIDQATLHSNVGFQGRLEVLHGGQFGGVCVNGFSSLAAEVACRQIGFSAGIVVTDVTFWPTPLGVPIVHSAAHCSGSESLLSGCDLLPAVGAERCNHVSLSCFNPSPPPPPPPPPPSPPPPSPPPPPPPSPPPLPPPSPPPQPPSPPPSPPPPSVSCEVSGWSEYSSCSLTCGGGTMSRSRSITRNAAHGGAGCPSLSETTACNTQGCPVSCEVSSWSAYSSCSRTCGGGTMSRSRDVTRNAANGGAGCPSLTESMACNTQGCPVSCEVSGWSAYSSCTKTCGGGTMSRSRSVMINAAYGGAGCPSLSESTACSTQPCDIMWVILENMETHRYAFDQGDILPEGNQFSGQSWMSGDTVIAPVAVTAENDYYWRARWNLLHKYDNVYLIQSATTRRYLLDTGSVLDVSKRGSENGWPSGPKLERRMTVTVDANYYDLALWKVMAFDGGLYQIENVKTHRYLFDAGKIIDPSKRTIENGWSTNNDMRNPLDAADANYYNRANWKFA